MPRPETDPYATLGLDRRCTVAQIRDAYRLLAKRHHPDVNAGVADALARTQQLNAAYEILRDPQRRGAYDEALAAPKKATGQSRTTQRERNQAQEVLLPLEDFLRGTELAVWVNDPANPDGAETYKLIVPPETAPGVRFRVPRTGFFSGGFVLVRVRPRPGFRFKPRGWDLRCDLRIQAKLAAEGGLETVVGITGIRLPVKIPKGVRRGETLRLPGQGMPKPRGGRGDLLVRITYRLEVRISRMPKPQR